MIINQLTSNRFVKENQLQIQLKIVRNNKDIGIILSLSLFFLPPSFHHTHRTSIAYALPNVWQEHPHDSHAFKSHMLDSSYLDRWIWWKKNVLKAFSNIEFVFHYVYLSKGKNQTHLIESYQLPGTKSAHKQWKLHSSTWLIVFILEFGMIVLTLCIWVRMPVSKLPSFVVNIWYAPTNSTCWKNN